MAEKKCEVLITVTSNPVEPISVWIDRPEEAISDILSVEGVNGCSPPYGTAGPLRVSVDPRYDKNEVATEIKQLLTASEDSVKRVDVSSIPIIAQGGDWYILGLNDGLVNKVLSRFHKAVPTAHWSSKTAEVTSEAANLEVEELEAIRDKIIREVVEEFTNSKANPFLYP